jgi:hypothetical protein
LYPDSNFSTLYYTRLKLGFNTKHSDKWSGLYVLLPILSSDYQNTGTTILYGNCAILTYKNIEILIISLAFMLEMKPTVLHNTISRYVL